MQKNCTFSLYFLEKFICLCVIEKFYIHLQSKVLQYKFKNMAMPKNIFKHIFFFKY